jgi:hypothetical protein
LDDRRPSALWLALMVSVAAFVPSLSLSLRVMGASVAG